MSALSGDYFILLTTRNVKRYSFSRLLKHDFDRFVLFFKTPHTISTTTHPMSKTPQHT